MLRFAVADLPAHYGGRRFRHGLSGHDDLADMEDCGVQI